MSGTAALAVTPDRRPMVLAEFHNAWGWAPSIWDRLLPPGTRWLSNERLLDPLWRGIEVAPEWQQAALLLTFDTGVIPWQAFEWAAEMLDEFEAKVPAPSHHANHVPAMAALLRTKPESPFFGVYGTSVSENPFDPWDEEADDRGSGIPLAEMYVLERHRHLLPEFSR